MSTKSCGSEERFVVLLDLIADPVVIVDKMGTLLTVNKGFEEITVQSSMDKGTTFTVTLPLRPKLEDGGEKMSKTARILVVDDDENIRKTLATILKDEGYIVDVAKDGSEAIKKTETAVYSVALIDIHLPDMEGIELLTRMKDAVPKTRKIIITGYPTVKNAIAAVNKKADAYLMKPVDVEKLLETIREQLRLQEAEKTYSEQKVSEFIETRIKELEA